MDTYKMDFETALVRTPQLGYSPTKISFNEALDYFSRPPAWHDLIKRALTGDHVTAFRQQIQREGFYLSPDRRKNNCCAVHAITWQGLQIELNAKAAFTVGYVSLPDGRTKFQTSIPQLADMIRAVSGTSATYRHVALHAWLTFDSGEILDLTIGPTLHAEGEPGFQDAEIIAGRPQSLSKLRYHPIAVGVGLVMRLKLLTN